MFLVPKQPKVDERRDRSDPRERDDDGHRRTRTVSPSATSCAKQAYRTPGWPNKPYRSPMMVSRKSINPSADRTRRAALPDEVKLQKSA